MSTTGEDAGGGAYAVPAEAVAGNPPAGLEVVADPSPPSRCEWAGISLTVSVWDSSPPTWPSWMFWGSTLGAHRHPPLEVRQRERVLPVSAVHGTEQ